MDVVLPARGSVGLSIRVHLMSVQLRLSRRKSGADSHPIGSAEAATRARREKRRASPASKSVNLELSARHIEQPRSQAASVIWEAASERAWAGTRSDAQLPAPSTITPSDLFGSHHIILCTQRKHPQSFQHRRHLSLRTEA
ncbi:hypothetical protein L1887_61496 [Cichorium endivia]|nr:hypothetical protein L1887_61496 [Cichorium endivia]